MKKYFEPFQLKRYVEVSGGWSDGEGEWIGVEVVSGRMRMLSANERDELPDVRTTHRFYTEFAELIKGDKLVADGKEYKVQVIEHKAIKTSTLDFFQVDCEGLQ